MSTPPPLLPPPLLVHQREVIYMPAVKKRSKVAVIVVLTVFLLVALVFLLVALSVLNGPETLKEFLAVDRWSISMGSKVQDYGKHIVTVNGLRCWRVVLEDGRTFLVVLKNEEIHSYRPYEDFLKDRKVE